MPYRGDLYYKMTSINFKSPFEKILFPDHWYDKDLPYLVSAFGENIPVNRVVAMFCTTDLILTGGGLSSKIFFIDENLKKPSFNPEDEVPEDIEFVNENEITPMDYEWWELQGDYFSLSYDCENRLKEEVGWSETICDLRSKNHHIWYLMWTDPLKLEYIEPGGNDEIWGEIGEVDYNDLMI